MPVPPSKPCELVASHRDGDPGTGQACLGLPAEYRKGGGLRQRGRRYFSAVFRNLEVIP